MPQQLFASFTTFEQIDNFLQDGNHQTYRQVSQNEELVAISLFLKKEHENYSRNQ